MLWHQYILMGFLISIFSELFLIRFIFKEKTWGQVGFLVLFTHCISHPMATFLFYFLGIRFIFVELIVVLIETLLYRKFSNEKLLKILLIVFLANVASILVGFFLREVFSISIYR